LRTCTVAVAFDCDSTLSAIEGIEELSTSEHAAEIKRWTTDAMEGRIPLEEVYGRRLALLRPTRDDVAEIGRRYVAHKLPRAKELVAALRFLEKRVIVVSGGLLPAVRFLARDLGIDEVIAVDVEFDEEGVYSTFDHSSPLARSGGKIDVLKCIASEDAGPIAFVGDGVTDLEAAHLAARFVAYGGVERREAVFAQAAVTCDSKDFADLVPLLLAPAEIEKLKKKAEFKQLVPSR
jgi:phosphoserine phosphatase